MTIEIVDFLSAEPRDLCRMDGQVMHDIRELNGMAIYNKRGRVLL